MDPKESLNDKSEELYEKLKAAGVEIELIVDKDAETWYVQNKLAFKIGSPDGKPNKPAMAHELLHIQLTLRGFDSVAGIYKYFTPENSFFDLEFIGALNNSLAHFKMIDDFTQMGFSVDEFLQDTPKTYFLDNILKSLIVMNVTHKTGTANICMQTEAIIHFCVSAKLFHLYKLKDPTTKNGVAEDVILEQLKKINEPLVTDLNDLVEWWITENTIHNLRFFGTLNDILKKHGIPDAKDCPPI